jgi:hypothetical protein
LYEAKRRAADLRPKNLDEPRKHRSGVTNGTRLFAFEGDGRSGQARRYKDILGAIVSDLGVLDCMSEAQKQLARRAATLGLMAEAMEADACAGRDFNPDIFGSLCDRQGRLLQRLGLSRLARDMGSALRNYVLTKDHLAGATPEDDEP